MPTYVFAYRAPEGYVAGGPDTVAQWRGWFGSMAARLVERGSAVFERGSVGSCGDGTVLGGYSLVTADDLEGALALAKGCPFVAIDGGVEVGELAILDAAPPGAVGA